MENKNNEIENKNIEDVHIEGFDIVDYLMVKTLLSSAKEFKNDEGYVTWVKSLVEKIVDKGLIIHIKNTNTQTCK